MRIVAGTHRGRILKSPANRTIRPTADKIRLAIFNALRHRDAIEGKVVLDAFCGTGALALEALSQGAGQAVMIDIEPSSLALAQANAQLLKIENRCRFLRMDATAPGPRAEAVSPADLCFLDPPYGRSLTTAALNALVMGGWLAAGCVIVAETEKSGDTPGVRVESEKIYGDTKIVIGYAA